MPRNRIDIRCIKCHSLNSVWIGLKSKERSRYLCLMCKAFNNNS